MNTDLRARFFDVRDLRILNLAPVSLSLAAGECVVLQGASGTGKSLLLRAIADLDAAAGSITLDGVDRRARTGPQWRKMVRYFAAEPGWWADRVGDHFPPADDPVEMFEALGIPAEALNWTIDRASTGEKQRLGLARGMIDVPQVLLLDEPTSALDQQTARAVEAVILDSVKARGAAAIVVTHDDAQAVRLAHRKLIIQGGDLVEVGL